MTTAKSVMKEAAIDNIIEGKISRRHASYQKIFHYNHRQGCWIIYQLSLDEKSNAHQESTDGKAKAPPGLAAEDMEEEGERGNDICCTNNNARRGVGDIAQSPKHDGALDICRCYRVNFMGREIVRDLHSAMLK